jgi:hypothetical protein
VVPRKSRTCSDVCEQRFDVSRIVRILARILIANALLFMTISMLLMIISRIMNTKLFSILFKRRTKSHDLYVRNVGGQMYVRRSVLVYMVTGLPVLSYDSFTTDESLDVETDVRSRLTCVWESHVQHFDIFHRTFGTMFGAGAIRDSLCTGTWGGV